MVADVCMRESREGDEFARLGGDEFAFLIPGVSQQNAMDFASRLRDLLKKKELIFQGNALRVTMSMGVAEWKPEIATIEELMQLADQGLYSAKEKGKNKIILMAQKL
jgi:diguanylate cyclase (GGDEF)-like protein